MDPAEDISGHEPSPPLRGTKTVATGFGGAIISSNSSHDVIADAFKKDPKYKRYVNAIDSILKLFDAVNEWADVIGFLSKLLKTLQMFSQYSNVPRKLIVSKRLAQCLNPALPSGVHQKTLEVYQAIFEAAGPAQLAEDLPLWSYGLFPFFQNAAMSVKPVILQIYDRHYLNLGVKLKPSLKGLILALLPGLEEEGNEFFDPVLRMLDKICETVGTVYFFHCMSLAIIAGHRLRGAGTNYLLRRMPKFSSKADIAAVLGNDTLVISRALAAALEDKQILVQRGALELLVVNFPIQNKINSFEFSLFPFEELQSIIRAAVSVVLRKDMSLNRRLYSWILGSSDNLNQYSLESLITTIRNMLWTYSDDIQELAKPYRIIISLMDKDEIGTVLLDRIILDIFKSLKQHSETYPNYRELLQSAEMLLDSVNPFIIWKHIYLIVIETPIESFKAAQAYEMLDYMLDILRIDEEDVKRVHLPIIFYWLSTRLEIFKTAEQFHKNMQKLPLFVRICSKVLAKIPRETIMKSWKLKNLQEMALEGLLTRNASNLPLEKLESVKNQSENISIASFCSILYGPSPDDSINNENDKSISYLSDFVVGRPVAEMSFQNFQIFLQSLLDEVVSRYSFDSVDDDESLLETALFGTAKNRNSIIAVFELTALTVQRLACLHVEVHQNIIAGSTPKIDWEWFGSLSDCVAHIIVQANAGSFYLNFEIEQFIQAAVHRLWFYLDPEPFAIYHTRAVDLIWQLIGITGFGSYIVENVVANFLSSTNLAKLVHHQQRFGILWRLSENNQKKAGITFSRPLFLVLDSLRSSNPSIRRNSEAWLKTYVKSYSRIIEPILATLLHRDIRVFTETTLVAEREEIIYFYKREFNMGQVLYSLEMLSLLISGYMPLLQNLWTEMLSDSNFLEAGDWLEEGENDSSMFVRTEIQKNPESKNEKLQAVNVSIQSQACEFIAKYLAFAELDNKISSTIAKPRLLLVLSSLNQNQERAWRTQRNRSNRRSSLTVSDALDSLIISGREVFGLSSSDSKFDEHFESFETIEGFLSMILEALSQATNRHVLQSWVDFIVLMLPRIHISFKTFLRPIISEICEEITQQHQEIHLYVQTCKQNFQSQNELGAPDNTVVIFVSGLDKIIEFCLENDTNWNSAVLEKTKSGSNLWDYNITGIVTSVFSDSPSTDQPQNEPQNSKDAILELLPSILNNLRLLFSLFRADPFMDNFSLNDTKPKVVNIQAISGASLEFLCLTVQKNLRRILGHIFTKYPAHLIAMAVEIWFACEVGVPETQWEDDRENILSMLHLVEECSPKIVLSTILDGLKVRFAFATNSNSSKDRSNPFYLHSKNIVNTDQIPIYSFFSKNTFDFVLVLKLCMRFGQVFMATQKSAFLMRIYWEQIISYLICCGKRTIMKNFLADKSANGLLRSVVTAAIEKLTMTRHFDDKRMRFHMDEIYQKLLDLTISALAKSAETQVMTPTATAFNSFEANNMPGLKLLPKPSNALISGDILLYIASTVVPQLRKLLLDQEKIIAVLNNIVYYIIGPNLKITPNLLGGKFRPSLETLNAISKLPFAVKTWKKEIWEAFLDSRFFDMHLEPFRLWKGIMNSLANADKDLRISEIAEQEQLQRMYFIRRLSFLLWCGTVDQYLAQLPLIQEKLVEILKTPSGPMHIEAYLCLRIQIFGVYLRNQGTNDDLQVFLACCKLLELLLLLGTEEFQWHQWIFIRETFDLNDESDFEESSTSLADKLSVNWGIATDRKSIHGDISSMRTFTNQPLRRPLLTMRTVLDKRQLAPFIATLSHHTYSSIFAGSKPDITFIEEVLEADLMAVDSAISSPIAGHSAALVK
ncbi:hypothetical protein HK100_012424 [Physocladia obscura]|uniref:Dopey N-terminal domain-containing protein n=1 Tax=Physocladia obscura TaxID=109957 RepID=A0AAD5T968_9FUNG|nr:hypothetical protein HK100_012424 [Physocladia obscura]